MRAASNEERCLGGCKHIPLSWETKAERASQHGPQPRSFYVSTDDIEANNWSDPVYCDAMGIDQDVRIHVLCRWVPLIAVSYSLTKMGKHISALLDPILRYVSVSTWAASALRST
jgi:hypothetical protein